MAFEKSEGKTTFAIKIDEMALKQVGEFLFFMPFIAKEWNDRRCVKQRVNVTDRMNGALVKVVPNEKYKKLRVAVHNYTVLVSTIILNAIYTEFLKRQRLLL